MLESVLYLHDCAERAYGLECLDSSSSSTCVASLPAWHELHFVPAAATSHGVLTFQIWIAGSDIGPAGEVTKFQGGALTPNGGFLLVLCLLWPGS